MKAITWLSIIGINENGMDGLCGEACAAISTAALVVGGKRHLELARELIMGETLEWPSPPHNAIPAIKAKYPAKVCVLCTGDPFNYGMGAVLAKHIPIEEMQVLPAPSIFSLVVAKLGWALQHTVTIGLNGRPVERIIPHLQPGAHLIVLSADERTPAAVATLLCDRGLGECKMTIMEHVGGSKERIRTLEAENFSLDDIARLNCMAIEVPDTIAIKNRCLPVTSGFANEWFDHDGQITKREVRAVTLSSLGLRKGELLWDIGLGSGSVAIEWLLCDPANRAVGFEKHPERAARAAANAKKLGVPQLVVMDGVAPGVFEGLEAPDAIFIGGGATVPGMMEAVWAALKSGGRLVINAISLETEALILSAHKHYGGELIRIGIERADNVGSMTGWRPAMTVTQWSVTKP